MTELTIRHNIADFALDYLGYNEADGSHRDIIDSYNKIRPLPRGYKMSYSDPWCAAFVSAVGHELGYSSVILPECSCDAMIELYKKAGRWKEADDYVPQLADIVMYDWNDSGAGDNTGSADHVGIVYAISGTSLTVIEGNKSDSVDFRPLNINGRYIRGYCIPDYASLLSEKTADPMPPESNGATRAAVNTLRNGSTGFDVMAMQALLEYAGYSTGPDGPDGDFGKNTELALEKFQRDVGLTADKVCGNNTWRALLGI